jgi:hypothetical protein
MNFNSSIPKPVSNQSGIDNGQRTEYSNGLFSPILSERLECPIHFTNEKMKFLSSEIFEVV